VSRPGAQKSGPSTGATTFAKVREKLKPVYTEPGQARIQALLMVGRSFSAGWKNTDITAMQLFEELCVQFHMRRAD
jgi:hypothetical protein